MAKILGYDKVEWVTAFILGIIFFSLWMFYGGGGDTPGQQSAKEAHRNALYQDVVLKTNGMESVRALLKDGDSAKFQNVYLHKSSDGTMVCGTVNSKNGFGAYAGYQKFVSAGSVSATFLQEQVKDFHLVWNKFCL